MWDRHAAIGNANGWDAEKTLASCLAGARVIDRCWGKRRALEKRSRWTRLQARLSLAQTSLERDPTSLDTQAEIAEISEQLNTLDSKQADWVERVMQARWLADGDKGSKIFFKSFKNLATSKHIPSMIDDAGHQFSSWDEMAAHTTDFFREAFGSGTNMETPDTRRMERDVVLAGVSDRLSAEDKASLNAPLELEELRGAMEAMKKNKCPGPDGVPVELFLAMWATVGPLVLQTINNGIEAGEFQAQFSQGLIVLFPKKGDQRLLSNKRPITLLNVAYKIGAKAMHCRLSLILQKLISPQQTAFLPGRNIHHSLVMLGEMLHQAEQLGEDYVLLKLDVVKAFDRLDWPFLIALLEKAGYSGMLTIFVKASFANASSAVLINGIPTERIPLARSVRQGCPLPPLLFIMAIDVLSLMLQQALDSGKIEGVRFPKVGIQMLHNFFADDVFMIIRALLHYIKELQGILDLFGAASGLVFAWEKTIAACIPAGPPPMSLWLYPWRWENDTNASPILGVPTAQTMSVELIETTVTEKLESRIIKFKARQLTLAARISVANSLLMGCIWYLLTIWAGKRAFLLKLQKIIESFVWAGRSRVKTVTLPRTDGGLNLMGIEAQYHALSANFMLWIMALGTHPLRTILRGHIAEASLRGWGIQDLSWLFSKCGSVKLTGSPTWLNICKGWAVLKKWLVPGQPANLAGWRALPLWRPHLNHVNPTTVKCSTVARRTLYDRGFVYMEDVMHPNGAFITWEEAQRKGAGNGGEAAFRNLLANLKTQPDLVHPEDKMPVFVKGISTAGRPLIWQFTLPAARATEAWLPFLDRNTPERTFRLEGNRLRATNCCIPTAATVLSRVMISSPINGRPKQLLGPWIDHNPLTQYKWKDGTILLNSSTSQLRSLQSQRATEPHSALRRWVVQLGRPIPEDIWHFTWLSFRSAAENTFLWQILYQIPATQKWRFPGRDRDDPVTWCSRCSLQVPEDTLHCIYGCPPARRCWDWGAYILQIAAHPSNVHFVLQPAHIMLADPLPMAWDLPMQLWHTLRAILCWLIWKDRNGHVSDRERSDSQGVIALAWHRLGLYMQIA